MTEIHTPICVECNLAMIMINVGTPVIELAGFQYEYAYKLWESDTYQCPRCYKKVAAGLTLASASHEDNFIEQVTNALKGKRVVYWHEKVAASVDSYPGLCRNCGHPRFTHEYEGQDDYPCGSTAHRSTEPCSCDGFIGKE